MPCPPARIEAASHAKGTETAPRTDQSKVTVFGKRCPGGRSFLKKNAACCNELETIKSAACAELHKKRAASAALLSRAALQRNKKKEN
jgi:hypothetical protein